MFKVMSNADGETDFVLALEGGGKELHKRNC